MPRHDPELREERRRELVDAAWRCVARTGYRDTSVDDICADAGVSKGSFYWYFKRKEDLLPALIEEEAATMERALAELVAGHRPGLARLRMFARGILDEGDDPALMRVRADLWGEVLRNPALRPSFIASLKRRRELLSQALLEGVATGEFDDRGALSWLLMALSDGLMLHGAVEPGTRHGQPLRKSVDSLLDAMARPQVRKSDEEGANAR